MQSLLSRPMMSLWGRLSAWAHLDAGSTLTDDLPTQPLAHEVRSYKLLRWPRLPTPARTARLLGALSVMSQRPVSVGWFARQTGWPAERAARFLETLADAGLAQRVGA
jgi:hypothetical protein